MKVRTQYYKWENLRKQVDLQQKACDNFYALLKAEELKFRSGESSLFLINARENKNLEAKAKLQELKVKYQLAGFELLWAAGLLQ